MAIYYVDFTTGNDADTGLTEALAWKTIAKVNGETFDPGDSILFKRGEIWREALIVPSSGTLGSSITFGEYGTGDKPIIYGSDKISTWADLGSNHWSATCATAPAQVWFVETGGTISTGDKKTYVDLSELVNEYDWCHNETTLYVYAATTPDTRYTSVEAPARAYCLWDNWTARSYITLDGIEFAYGNEYGIFAGNGEGTTWVVQNCAFTKCGIELTGPSFLIQDNTLVGPCPVIGFSAGGAIQINGSYAIGCSVLRNTVSYWDGRGIWVFNGADTPTVNDNIIHDCLDVGINFDGYSYIITGTVTALRNTVYNCVCGIYLENCSDGSVVHGNLIHDLIPVGGFSAGIWSENYEVHPLGHYTEQRGNNVGCEISYNVFYDLPNSGIYLNSVSGIDIWNNVLIGSVDKIGVNLSTSTTAYYTDIDIRNNVFSGFDVVCAVPDANWTNNLVAFDYNAVGAPSDAVIQEKATPTNLTLANLQDASQALHCFSTDPGFVDAVAHNYHLLATSPCINAGVDVGLTEDFEGNPIV